MSKNLKFNFFAKSLPTVDFPEPIIPTNIRFLFDFISFSIEKTQICLNLKLLNDICIFKKKQVLGKSTYLIKILIKIALLFLMVLFLIVLVDKINFPYPNKKIEKIVPNETFKVVK